MLQDHILIERRVIHRKTRPRATTILAECRIAWNLPEAGRLDYHWLRDKFSRYFARPGV